jgi:hypothetical protein
MIAIQLNEVFQMSMQVFIILGIVRFVFVIGILFFIIAVKTAFSGYKQTEYKPENRLSPKSTFDVILSQFFMMKSEHFSREEVYY